MAEVAQAVVAIIPSARGFSKKLNRELGGQIGGVGDKQGRTLGSRMSASMGRALKVGAKTAAVGAGIAAGAGVIGGFRSAVSQQNAQKVFSGLYGSTEKATAMMKDLRKISSESAIGYETYTKAGQSLAYAGIQGQDAVGILDNVGKAIVAAGGDAPQMESAMGGVMKAVNNGGIAMMDSLSMISESGVPILSGLGEKFGKSTDQIKKMASEGEITIEDVMSVMQKGTGDTFQQMIKAGESANKSFGNTFKRIKDNAITSIGTGLVPMLDRATPALERFGSWLDRAIPAGMATLGSAASAVAPVLRDLGGTVLSGLSSALGWIAPHLRSFASSMAGLAPQAKALASSVGSFLVAAFRAAKPYLETFAQIVGAVLVGAMKALPPILRLVMAQFQNVLSVVRPLLPLVAGLTTAFVVYRGVMFAAGVATKVWAAITKAAAVAQRILNAAMRANPIGLLVTAITLLVGALVYLYKNNDTARRIMRAAWAGIKAAISGVVNWFRNVAWPAMRATFRAVAAVAKWLWQKGIKPAFNGIAKVIRWWYNNIVKRYFAMVRGAFRVVASVAKWLWQKGIRPAFRGIVVVGKWLWARLKSYFSFIGNIFRGAARVARWLWRNGIRPAFQGIAKVGSWLWGRMKASFNFISNGFRGVQRVAKWLWGHIKTHFGRIAANARWLWGKVKWALDKIRGGMGAVRRTISSVAGSIKRTWKRMYGYIKDPIVDALKWLQKNFVKKLRGFLGKIPGVSASIIPNIGIPKGWAGGGWTGPGSKYAPAGVVHADEYVVQKSARRRFERDNPGVLDHINRTGQMPGYAGGGYVYPHMVRWIKNKIPSAIITSTKRNWGGRSYHERGKAIDVGGSGALMKRVAQTIKSGFGSSIAQLIHNPGFSVANGKNVSTGYWGGSTWAGHRDHVHWAMESMSAAALKGMKGVMGSLTSGGGGWMPAWASDPMGWIKDKVKGLMSKWDPKKYGIAGEIIPSVANKVRDAVGKKIQDAASLFSLDGGGNNMDWSGIKSGPNRIMGKQMAERYGWTGGQWSALRTLWEKESNWNHRAKNPSSGAYGIPQSLPASKMASAGSDWRTNPRTQIAWGLNYIKGRYGSPGAALSFHNRRNWYADGGLVTPPVFDNGGTLAPGYNLVHNATGKPEPLIRPEAALSGPVTVNVVDRDGTLLDRIRGEIDMADRHAATRSRMGAGRRY